MKENPSLPKGWVRDSKNPGLIKLSGNLAEEHNEYIRVIQKLHKRVDFLEKEILQIKSLFNKLNKQFSEE